MISVLFPHKTRSRAPKLHASTGLLQPFIDHRQPPTKRGPWRQVCEIPFIKAVTISLPSSFYEAIWTKVDSSVVQANYAKVFMNLEDILTGEFFNTYIKVGNILMISEGQPGVENIFTLCEGVLRLDLGKADYQRAGLQGIPSAPHGGRKHIKERFTVELNLRAQSMIKGKKGFERLLYAAKNVLNHTKVWLVRDLMSDLQRSEEASPIMKHHPTIIKQDPQIDGLGHVAVPDMISNPNDTVYRPTMEEQDDYYEITEWLNLVEMKSPRVQRYHHSDPYVCRYMPPGMYQGEPPPSRPTDLKILQWKGLFDSGWLTKLLIEIIKQSRKNNSTSWVAITVNAHDTQALGQIDGYSVLLQPHPQQPLTLKPGFAPSSGQESSQMEIESTEAPGETSALSAAPNASGLQRFMSFQFVDS